MTRGYKYEASHRIQSVHERRGASHVRAKGRNLAARSRIQEAGRSESAKARAKAEGQALRLGPRDALPLNLFWLLFGSLQFAGKLGISEALASDLGNRQSEPLGIIHLLEI